MKPVLLVLILCLTFQKTATCSAVTSTLIAFRRVMLTETIYHAIRQIRLTAKKPVSAETLSVELMEQLRPFCACLNDLELHDWTVLKSELAAELTRTEATTRRLSKVNYFTYQTNLRDKITKQQARNLARKLEPSL